MKQNNETNRLLFILYVLSELVYIMPIIEHIIKEQNTVHILHNYLPIAFYPVYTLIFSLLFISITEHLTIVKKIILSFNYVFPLISLNSAMRSEYFEAWAFISYILFALNLCLIVFTIYSAFSKKLKTVSPPTSKATAKKALKIISASAFYIGWISAISFMFIEKYAPADSFLFEMISMYTGEGLFGLIHAVLPISSVISGAVIFLFRDKLTASGKAIIFFGNIMMALTFFGANFKNNPMILITSVDILLIAASLWIFLSKNQRKDEQRNPQF